MLCRQGEDREVVREAVREAAQEVVQVVVQEVVQVAVQEVVQVPHTDQAAVQEVVQKEAFLVGLEAVRDTGQILECLTEETEA